MGFRFWLESDEIHPFQQWHNDYEQAYQKDKTGPWPYPGSYRQYPLSKALLNDPRRRQSAVLVLEVTGYSSGSHGWGNQPETPAGNPLKYPAWEIAVETPIQDSKLVGKTAVICDTSGGSYHERWANFKVYVFIDTEYHDSEYDEPNTTLGSFQIEEREIKSIKKFFKYQGIEQAKQEIISLEPNIAFAPLPGEDSSAYWDRITQAEKERQMMSRPPGGNYDDRDSYFKK